MSFASLRERDRDNHSGSRILLPPKAVAEQPASSGDCVRLVVKNAGGVVLLPIETVECLEADGNVVIVHCSDGARHRIRESLSTMFEQLRHRGFIRIHRGTLVSVAAIVGVEKGRYRKAYCVLRTAGKFEIGRVEFQRLRPLWQPGVLDVQALSAGMQLIAPA